MDFIQILLIMGVVTGSVLVLVSCFGKKNEEPVNNADFNIQKLDAPAELTLGKKLEAVDNSISEADNVMKEMDQKYNELLYLYNLIDEKQKNISTITPPLVPVVPARAVIHETAPVLKKQINPRSENIIRMKHNGMSVAQIAKELKMGQGEVSLILRLSTE